MVKLYADRGLQSPLKDIHLGIVEVGKSHQFTVYAHNPTRANILDIQIFFDPVYKGLEVISLPENIGPEKIGQIMIRWSPPLTLRRELITAITITYKELYVAR